jgi:hypothetical protein
MKSLKMIALLLTVLTLLYDSASAVCTPTVDTNNRFSCKCSNNDSPEIKAACSKELNRLRQPTYERGAPLIDNPSRLPDQPSPDSPLSRDVGDTTH